jgi:hypothetical protein
MKIKKYTGEIERILFSFKLHMVSIFSVRMCVNKSLTQNKLWFYVDFSRFILFYNYPKYSHVHWKTEKKVNKFSIFIR